MSKEHDGSQRPRSLAADLFMTSSSGASERSTPVTVRMTVNFDHFTNNPRNSISGHENNTPVQKRPLFLQLRNYCIQVSGLVYWWFLWLLEISSGHVSLSYCRVRF
ncbi:hypothetical protein Zmor_021770 [Zophobas morio]|uniref:Uncharacterized protein n=1 Tax=Zophobas morio TaxID=2755281 RepID=A0AA38MBG5_9CUCU|nr:hypothetical protein Zmor_021770 [Zophobas morio]